MRKPLLDVDRIFTAVWLPARRDRILGKAKERMFAACMNNSSIEACPPESRINPCGIHL